MPIPPVDRRKAEKTAQGTRLNSWKEVAAYLGKGERTVKRWEIERGLPAYRVPGGGRAPVYAFTSELDEWLGSQSSRVTGHDASAERNRNPELSSARPIASGPAPSEISPRRVRATRVLASSFAVLLLVLGTAATLYFGSLRTVAAGISARLNSVRLTGKPAETAKAGPTAASAAEKLLAHDLCLRGRYDWNQRTPASLNRALDYFTQAVVHDPGSAQAYAGMADTYNLLREYSIMPDTESYPRAIAAARKAVELEDSLSEAHRALAFAETFGSWDFVEGEKEFHRAIELNPRDPTARLWYANAFAFPGRFQSSLEEIDKAQELDPSSHAILADKGLLLYYAGRNEDAIKILQEVERTNPGFRSPHSYFMFISLALGDYPRYLSEGEKAAQSQDDPVQKDIMASARAGYARDGKRGFLQNLYAAQKKYYAEGKFPGTLLALTCVPMGKKHEALQFIEEDYSNHRDSFLVALKDPVLRQLAEKPRYQALKNRINIPPPPQANASLTQTTPGAVRE
jgi:tetratricopeptide (TPR) repeat protein